MKFKGGIILNIGQEVYSKKHDKYGVVRSTPYHHLSSNEWVCKIEFYNNEKTFVRVRDLIKVDKQRKDKKYKINKNIKKMVNEVKSNNNDTEAIFYKNIFVGKHGDRIVIAKNPEVIYVDE